jgi:hypothetical protein
MQVPNRTSLGFFQREDAGSLPETAKDDGFYMRTRRHQTVRDNQAENITGEAKGAI